MNYGGVATPKSPYRVGVSSPLNASKVQVFGPGVEKGVRATIPTHFNVDARAAGSGIYIFLFTLELLLTKMLV